MDKCSWEEESSKLIVYLYGFAKLISLHLLFRVTHPSVPDIPHPDSTNSDGEGPPLHLAIACSPDVSLILDLHTKMILTNAFVESGCAHRVIPSQDHGALWSCT